MKAVLVHVDEQDLDRRRKLGLDHWDEMWEGVLHMSPAPSFEHQRIQKEILVFLDALVKRKKRGTIAVAVNVFGKGASQENYRVPDLVFVAAGRESVIAEDGIRGGPDAVIEIRSPDDETYEKLPFFAVLGVREVIVVGRDSKKPEVFRLAGSQYVAVAADRDGMITSEVLGVRFGCSAGKLILEDAEDPGTSVRI
ncbi:MAG: Uma2 family endonuclease [Planctomycetes bacterium]|nr:Uma2 family endonuclease [Planctomycetota bacterium]